MQKALNTQGTFECYRSSGNIIHWALREICRLRRQQNWVIAVTIACGTLQYTCPTRCTKSRDHLFVVFVWEG